VVAPAAASAALRPRTRTVSGGLSETDGTISAFAA
jgi:hypothetical protein